MRERGGGGAVVGEVRGLDGWLMRVCLWVSLFDDDGEGSNHLGACDASAFG